MGVWVLRTFFSAELRANPTAPQAGTPLPTLRGERNKHRTAPLPSPRPICRSLMSGSSRKPVVVSDGSDEDSGEKDSSKPSQWVVAIVAQAKDSFNELYFFVRWGADDDGQPFDVGKEAETWEPAWHLDECPVARAPSTASRRSSGAD